MEEKWGLFNIFWPPGISHDFFGGLFQILRRIENGHIVKLIQPSPKKEGKFLTENRLFLHQGFSNLKTDLKDLQESGFSIEFWTPSGSGGAVS